MANIFGWMVLRFFLSPPCRVFVGFSSNVTYSVPWVVLVQAEIFHKHFMVLLATSKTKMKSEQIPQSIKE